MENLLLKLSRSFKPSGAKMRWVISGREAEWLDYDESRYVWEDDEAEQKAGWMHTWMLMVSWMIGIVFIYALQQTRTPSFDQIPRSGP